MSKNKNKDTEGSFESESEFEESTGSYEVEHGALDEHDEDLKSQVQDELEEELEDSEQEPTNPVLKVLKSQVPSLFKLVSFVQNKLPKTKVKSPLSEETEEEVETDQSKKVKPKKKLKVIHVMILIGLGVMLFEEEILGTGEEDKAQVAQVKVKKPRKPIRKKIAKKKAPVKAKVVKKEDTVIEKNDDPLMIGANSNTETNSVDTSPSVKPDTMPELDSGSEDITNLFKEEMKNPTTVDTPVVDSKPSVDVPVVIEPVIVEPAVEATVTKVDPQVEDNKRKEDSEKVIAANVIDDPNKDKDFLVSSFNDESEEDITNSIMADLEKKVLEDKDKKQSELDEVANSNYDFIDVPNYEVNGRGLVYNCEDGHWACVDVQSYGICQKNLRYNQSKQKAAQCFPKAIYNSDIDCEKIQLDYVSNSFSTDFCD